MPTREGTELNLGYRRDIGNKVLPGESRPRHPASPGGAQGHSPSTVSNQHALPGAVRASWQMMEMP